MVRHSKRLLPVPPVSIPAPSRVREHRVQQRVGAELPSRGAPSRAGALPRRRPQQETQGDQEVPQEPEEERTDETRCAYSEHRRARLNRRVSDACYPQVWKYWGRMLSNACQVSGLWFR